MIRHPHAGEDARRLAEAGTVLLTQVGSGVHGTAIDGQDDRDELGLCLEPVEFVTGLARVRTPGGREIAFEQYELHTAWSRSRGLAEPSGPGDLDVVVYSARKWARLAVAGNPTVLLPLWVPDTEVVRVTAAGRELRAQAERFASRTAGRRFLGYLRSQRDAFAARRTRARAASRDGGAAYDAKRATHALRLGLQGLELLRSGRVTLPVPAPELAELRQVRRGEWDRRHVEAWIAELEADLAAAVEVADLPEQADRAWVDAWLTRSHQEFWAAR
ncbi:DNA polymerase beta superfamily protein [Kineococcus rhizosphaerae]|uniref:Putative nucleotidyltransferase n=1 Tax=Kineococcus rhizosphaerae TaxID=559628 RepID=A0A2T0RAE6_9ACTN|nr:nucleotidyltransferase domain-containing protein [Kineococcus rhizosphaerae]PRY18135.1 putative nucleotidyltransferase [Kineococcus rhizosphaerae]